MKYSTAMKNTFFMLFFSMAISFIACGGGGENDENLPIDNGNTEKPKDDESQEPVLCSITPIGELNQGTPIINSHTDVTKRSSLMMNYRMFVTMESSYPRYPRIKKMKNGDYILFYHNGSANNNIGRRCVYALSKDMKTWINKGEIFNSYDIIDSKGNKNIHCYANCDGLVLSNGDILAVASCRANSGYRDLPEDAGIELRRSTDNGVTWSEPVKIYQGVNWEPFLLELPTGELHCYFTDSSRTGLEGHGTDTGTAMVVSTDGGKTWKPDFSSSPYYVLRMRWEKNGIVGYNHQMPSVVRLNDNKGLAAAVETNNSGYHISLCYSDKDKWEYLAADQEGPVDSNNCVFSGMGPYLGQLPSGETVLSYESSSKYTLKIGDATARNFGSAYQPFSGGYWGSFCIIDSHTLVGTNIKAKEGPVQMAQFVLNHRIDAVKRKVTIDGNNKEWANTDHALFVGSKSQAQGTLRCSYDDDNIYFLLEVLDRNLLASDYASLYVSPVSNNKLSKGACCIQVTMNGLKNCEIYDASWKEAQLDAQVKTYVCNETNERLIDDYGYIAEIAIPRSKLTITSGQVLVNFSITKRNSLDAICDVASTSTARWIPVTGL
jgi:hypothetical protein